MGMKSKSKGKTGERELSKELSRLFGADCHRGQQYCGANGDGDVVGLPGVHVECKRTESFRLWDAINQAVADAKSEDVPMVCHRANGRPWVAVVRLDDLPALVSKLYLTMAAKG